MRSLQFSHDARPPAPSGAFWSAGRARSRYLLLAGGVAETLALAACGSSSSGKSGTASASGGGTINIGVIGPMTGSSAEIGNLMSGACYAAAHEVNAAGGVLGRTVSCKLIDDTGDPADAVPNVTRALATTGNLDMAVGLETNTAATTIPLVNNAHIPMVTTNGLPSYDSTTDTYFWRMTASDEQNGAAFVAWAVRQGYKRVALIFQNNGDSQSNQPGAVAAMGHSGGTMTANLTIPGDASSYSSVVARVIAGKPQALIFAADPQTSATFLSEYRQLNGGKVPPVITATESLTPAFFSTVQKVMGTAYMTHDIALIGTYISPSTSAYSLYKQAIYGTPQIKDPATILGVGTISAIYDGINLMSLAMDEAHSTSGAVYNSDIAKIASGTPGSVVVDSYAAGLAALKAGKQIHYEGVGGAIHFNAHHNSPGNFSASGFAANGSPTFLGEIPGTEVQSLVS